VLLGILVRLTTGSSWVDIEALLGHEVSDTTLRARRDEWINAGVFDALADEALAGYDRILEPTMEIIEPNSGRWERFHAEHAADMIEDRSDVLVPRPLRPRRPPFDSAIPARRPRHGAWNSSDGAPPDTEPRSGADRSTR
jgi:hypothetical protein